MASIKASHLYGIPRPKKASSGKDITSSSTISFNAALSSLISTPTNTAGTSGRGRKPKGKDDIFTVHNRNTKKRAAADELAYEDEAAKLKTSSMDEASYKRARRKMEEKARLYAAMKRGDVEDEHDRHMVDFDRKWAEKEEQRNGAGGDATSSDDDDGGESEEEVEFLDEFGRTRKGTRAEAAREERRKQQGHRLEDESDRYAPRPNAPRKIIFGDTIQADAFNPDEPITAQMEALAEKRDRELTPPPDQHYDAEREVRNKGTGFFQFSRDEEERKAQMEELERERQETEKARAEKGHDERREQRKREIEERRQLIKQKKGQSQANRFLEELGKEMAQDGPGVDAGE